MLRFVGPRIVTFGLLDAKELSDFSVVVSIGANGSLERAAGFGDGVLVLNGDSAEGGTCEFVFASTRFAGLASAAGGEVEARHLGG